MNILMAIFLATQALVTTPKDLMYIPEGTSLTLDMESVDLTSQYRERILALIEERVDTLILSPEQAFSLSQLPPKQAIEFLQNFCTTVIIKTNP